MARFAVPDLCTHNSMHTMMHTTRRHIEMQFKFQCHHHHHVDSICPIKTTNQLMDFGQLTGPNAASNSKQHKLFAHKNFQCESCMCSMIKYFYGGENNNSFKCHLWIQWMELMVAKTFHNKINSIFHLFIYLCIFFNGNFPSFGLMRAKMKSARIIP